jgi:hypothetical protein
VVPDPHSPLPNGPIRSIHDYLADLDRLARFIPALVILAVLNLAITLLMAVLLVTMSGAP